MRITDTTTGIVFIENDKIATHRHIIYCFECETPEDVSEIQNFIKKNGFDTL